MDGTGIPARLWWLLATRLLVTPLAALAASLAVTPLLPAEYPGPARTAGAAVMCTGFVLQVVCLIGRTAHDVGPLRALASGLQRRATEQVLRGRPPVRPDEVAFLRGAAVHLGRNPWQLAAGAALAVTAAGGAAALPDSVLSRAAALWVFLSAVAVAAEQTWERRRARAFLLAYPG